MWNGLRAKTFVNKNLCLQRKQKKNSGFGGIFLSSALCYARLYLNLGPSKLSVHRWTLTARRKKFFR
jgi:hypothetical protein